MKKLLLLLILIPFLNACTSNEETVQEIINKPSDGVYIGKSIIAYNKGDYNRSILYADSALAMDGPNVGRSIAHKVRGKSKWALNDANGACDDWQTASMYNENASPSSEEEILLKQHCSN